MIAWVQLAGLTESFSRKSFFCSTCYTDYETFQKDPFQFVASKTPVSNREDLEMIESNPDRISYRGVKSGCILDELRHFEMFDMGAAPCIAHDLFEGWVNYDLYLIFKRLVCEGIFTASYLQRRSNSLFKQLKISSKFDFNFSRKANNFKAKACDLWHLTQICHLF